MVRKRVSISLGYEKTSYITGYKLPLEENLPRAGTNGQYFPTQSNPWAISNDGRWLVRAKDFVTFENISKLKNDKSPAETPIILGTSARSVLFSPDSKLIAVAFQDESDRNEFKLSTKPEVNVYKMNGILVERINLDAEPHSIAFSPDSKSLIIGLASEGKGGVKIHKIKVDTNEKRDVKHNPNTKELWKLQTRDGQEYFVRQADFSQGNRLATSNGKKVILWDSSKLEPIVTVSGSGGHFVNNEQDLLVNNYWVFSRLNSANGKLIETYKALTYPEFVDNYAVSADGKSATTFSSDDLVVFNTSSTKVREIAIRVWSSSYSPFGGVMPSRCLAMSSNGKLIAGSHIWQYDGRDGHNSFRFSMWDSESGREIANIKGEVYSEFWMFSKVWFSRDGKQIYILGLNKTLDTCLGVFEAKTLKRERLVVLQSYADYFAPTKFQVALSADRSWCALVKRNANDNTFTIQLLDTTSGKQLDEIPVPADMETLGALAISPDGNTIVSGGPLVETRSTTEKSSEFPNKTRILVWQRQVAK